MKTDAAMTMIGWFSTALPQRTRPVDARMKIRPGCAIDMPRARAWWIAKMPLYTDTHADPAVAMSTTLRDCVYIAER